MLAFGCSGALYNAIAVLCETGDNLLVPRPGFPLALPIAENLGINLKHYDLLPEKGWEIDLDSLRALVDDKTKAILVNNPSNPCGTCFSKRHQLEIIALADELKIPLIADEVYHGLVYEDEAEFHSFGNLTKEVPVICTGAISKIYALPGWRLGWTIVYNNGGYFDRVNENLHKHAMIQLHPTSLVQAALPRILKEVTPADMQSMKDKLRDSSRYAYEKLSGIRGITPLKANAAMYMMVRIDIKEFADIEDDVQFCSKLLNEQCCLVFPSSCFFAKNFFRVVICTSKANLDEFSSRVAEFCAAHHKADQ